ncbi:ECs_2282 family putative zinc-binding protein [Morganella morganii]
MSKINFKCPGCGKDLVVSTGVEIKSVDDLTDAKCSSCGRNIRKDDLAKQARDYVAKTLKDAFRKL